MMDDDIHEIEDGANTSTNASRRPSCLGCRQALADSMMKSVEASVSKLRRGDPPTIYIVPQTIDPPTIYMAPQTIRQVKEVAYDPQIVSIGPYHHGKKSLQRMEEHKWLYLHSFLSRNPNHPLDDYLKAMEELEDKAGSCYYDNIGPQVDNEFVKMMVLDACFILELFLRFQPIKHLLELLEQRKNDLEQKEKDLGLFSAMKFFIHSSDFKDPMRHTIGMRSRIGYDLLLLENQIPFFVLQHIFKMACPVNIKHLLENMALDFFDQFMTRNKKIEINDSYYHLLHLFHSHLILTDSEEERNLSCNPTSEDVHKFKKNEKSNTIKYVLDKLKNLLIFLPRPKETSSPNTEWREMIPCATDLQLAGVKFKKNKNSNNILNVKFSDGLLEITPFVIHDYSDTLFRNLLAFEQCHPETNDHFTTYLVFMDCLVNTSKDVALLHQNGIIDNLLGSDDDVTHLFNRLCIGIFHSFEGSHLWDVKDKLQKHYDNKCNKWWASFKRDYFSNPWSVISLIAATILLLLTITQTFFTVFAYYRPRS